MLDRTFAIGTVYKNKDNDCIFNRGTAWFVDKVNRNDNNDYKYWIATNLHVCTSVTNYKSKDKNTIFDFFIKDGLFDTEEIAKNLSLWNDIIDGNKKIIKFDINSVEGVKNQNFTSDFCIFKIEFSIDNIPKPYKKNVKNWLDSLNRRLLINNSFVTYTTNILTKDTKVYSLGYPSLGETKFNFGNGLEWKLSRSICAFQIAEIYFNKKDYISGGSYHKSIYGIRNVDHSDFGDGSSGSVIIDENFNVIGIHYASFKDIHENSYGYTNISDCLYVNDEYNPIATFLQD